MMDKDSKLIFENYNKKIKLNEGLAAAAIPIALPAGAVIAAKSGATREFMDWFKKTTGVDLDQFTDSWGGATLRFFDITGISSWPALQKAQEAYNQNPNDWETNVEWWSQFFGTIPLMGSVFRKIIGGISALGGGKLAMGLLRKILYYVSKDKKLQSITRVGIKKWIQNYTKYKAPSTEKSKEFKQHIEIVATYLSLLYGRAMLEFLTEFTELPPHLYTIVKEVFEAKAAIVPETTESESEQTTEPSETQEPETTSTNTPESDTNAVNKLESQFGIKLQ